MSQNNSVTNESSTPAPSSESPQSKTFPEPPRDDIENDPYGLRAFKHEHDQRVQAFLEEQRKPVDELHEKIRETMAELIIARRKYRAAGADRLTREEKETRDRHILIAELTLHAPDALSEGTLRGFLDEESDVKSLLANVKTVKRGGPGRYRMA